MLKHLRDALLDKLEETRDIEEEPYYTIQWSDTKQIEVHPQRNIRLSPSEEALLNVTYTIYINHQRRYGIILAKGKRKDCESLLDKRSSKVNDTVDDLMLMAVLAKILNGPQSDEDDDVHHVQCSSCRVKPIRQVDRYRCLECSLTSPYDLCGRCFEKRCVTGKHQTGHPMIHFKLANEFLGIPLSTINKEINLDTIRQLTSLRSERHDQINCDGGCGERDILGLRFKCDQCPNYDLCERCALQKHVVTKTHEKEHPLILTSSKVIPKIDPDDIDMGDELGRGAFGYVCKSWWKSKKRQVACKVIEVSGSSSMKSNDLQRSFLLEIAAYRELSGPYILRTFAYATQDLPPTRIRGVTTRLIILMELMGRGSLQNVLDKEPNQISLRRKLTIARQIASGMRRIHQHGMIHRDIRPDNILVNDDYVAKIGDMGIARVLDPQGQQTQMGCLQFMPPEFYLHSADGHVKCDQKLDIYTYGLTLNQLFTETMHLFRLNAPLSSRVTILKQSPIFYDDIIRRCLNDNPKERPTAMEIEKTLEVYERSFSQTMITDEYTRMTGKEKDRVFLQFYHKNQAQIQRFLREQLLKQIPN